MEVFSIRLKEERINNKFSQAQMAEKLGLHIRTYAHYEQLGLANREPPFDLVVEIAKILDVSTDYLFGLTD